MSPISQLWPEGINCPERLASVRDRLELAQQRFDQTPWFNKKWGMTIQTEVRGHMRQMLDDMELLVEALEKRMAE